MVTKLTIGLPIYNEEKSLPDFLERLGKAVEQLPKDVEVETIACLNGCTDKSAEIIEQVAQSPLGEKLHLRRIESTKGKMNAEIEIVKQRKHDGPICFMDADTLPSPNILASLLKAQRDDPGCFVSFGRVEPYYPPEKINRLSYFQDALRVYYKSRDYAPPKPYIHGRAFMMRDDSIFHVLDSDWEKRASEVKNQDLARSLNLKEGPWADDVYFSRAVAHHYGLDSIKEVRDAKVYFHPPEHEMDYESGIRRLVFEIKRLGLLYPEYGYLEDKFAKKQQCDPEVLKNALTPDEYEKLKFIKTLEKTVSARAQRSIDEMNYTELGQGDLWGVTASTKKAFRQEIGTELAEYDAKIPRKQITSVLVVPMTKEGSIVTVKNKRGWDLPGGHIERSDADLLATARREAMEEAQITLRNVKPCKMIKFKSDKPENDTYMVVMGALVDQVKPFKPTDEISARDIIPAEEFLERYEGGNKGYAHKMIEATAKALDIASYRGKSRQ